MFNVSYYRHTYSLYQLQAEKDKVTELYKKEKMAVIKSDQGEEEKA